MKSTNLDIQFVKFIYSWAIVIYHLAASTAVAFKGGYCGVEYFLLTAGVFLFLSFEKGGAKGMQKTPGEYLRHRFSRFFPWSLTAYLLCVVVEYGILNPITNLSGWMDLAASGLWELLMIKGNGMNNDVHLLNGPAWTLSAMLIIGFFIWTFMYFYKKPFVNLIMPMTLIAGFGYWMHLPSANTESWMGITTFGTFRTWLIMCLSYYCLPMSRKLAAISFNKKGKWLLTAAEVVVHLFALTVMVFRATRYYQWVLTLMFMVSISIAMSGHSYLAKLLEGRKLIRLMGDLSMSIYLVHTPVIRLFRFYCDISSWGMMDLIPVFAAIMLVAVLHDRITRGVMKYFPPLWRGFLEKITN